jgi:hypothetical protein
MVILKKVDFQNASLKKVNFQIAVWKRSASKSPT